MGLRDLKVEMERRRQWEKVSKRMIGFAGSVPRGRTTLIEVEERARSCRIEKPA